MSEAIFITGEGWQRLVPFARALARIYGKSCTLTGWTPDANAPAADTLVICEAAPDGLTIISVAEAEATAIAQHIMPDFAQCPDDHDTAHALFADAREALDSALRIYQKALIDALTDRTVAFRRHSNTYGTGRVVKAIPLANGAMEITVTSPKGGTATIFDSWLVNTGGQTIGEAAREAGRP